MSEAVRKKIAATVLAARQDITVVDATDRIIALVEQDVARRLLDKQEKVVRRELSQAYEWGKLSAEGGVFSTKDQVINEGLIQIMGVVKNG